MDRQTVVSVVIGLTLGAALLAGTQWFLAGDATVETPDWRQNITNDTIRKATLAGGCFWCIEAAFEDVEGVASAVSGYAGGKASTATYDQVLTGTTDHREAVRLRYYPAIINYTEILDLFWRSFDPTDAGGQFTDRGPQYTTAIYAHTSRQYRLAVASKQALNASGRFDEPVVTEVLNATTFFRAEDKHQNYSRRNSVHYSLYERASGRKGFTEQKWQDSPLN